MEIAPDPYSVDQQIPSDHLVNVCRYKRPGCCRYIVFPKEKTDYYCVKKIPHIKAYLDQLEDMMAQGDNCQGLPDEEV